MRSQAHTSPLTSQVTATVLALAFFTLVLVVGFGTLATISADQASLRRQTAFVENGLRDAVTALKREQESVTVWDDAVTFTKARDKLWMNDNVGEWLHSYYGHDRTYVFDEQNRPTYAVEDGKQVAPDRYAEAEPVVAPKLAELRALMNKIASSDEADPPKAAVEDLVTLAGKPTILSIMPIVPSTDRLSQEPGTEYLHVTMKFIDEEVVGLIARQYMLTGAQVMPLLGSPAAASVPLVDSHGVILGCVGWIPDRPGLTLVRETAPAILGGVLLTAGVLSFLLRRLRRASTALQTSQNQAEFLAFHDTLTGLPNRALFEDRLRRAFITARRERARIALLYIDLDRFKHVNDTLGHPAGDELVRQTARRLESQVREVDTVARLGGDEFAVIMAGVRNVGAAGDLSENILAELVRPFLLMGDHVFVSASIGIAVSLESDTDPGDLLRKADIALYEAKRAGRGRYQIFAGDMDDIITRRRLVESDLRVALQKGDQLKLVYQPIFSTDGYTMLGAEALLRWNHPVHGALSPSHFISIAEERGIIDLLGTFVLSCAARFAATTDLPWIAVNVSPLQLRDEDFAERLLAILEVAGLAPSRLQVEITEGVLLDDSTAATAALSSLRDAGVRVVLDDFGTGYSSIGYLRRYAVDKLKIDRSFVHQLGPDDESHAIVEAIIRLARALKLPVTVEGVETAEQLDLVVAMGCTELQGYLLSAPVEEAEMRVWQGGGRSALPQPAATG